MEREDVWVTEPGGDRDLAGEPFAADNGRELRPEHLQGDRTAVPEVVREVDCGHPAAAELALDRVTVGHHC